MFIARPDNRDPAPVGASWQRIEAWFRARQPEVVESLQPGASAEQVSDFERSTGLTLPDDVKASYRIHDGQKNRYGPGLLLGAGLNSLAEVRDNWEFFAGLEVEYSQQDVSNDADEECSSFPEGAIRCVDVNSRWVPLHNWDGDCYGIDLDPGPNGVRGQVINFGRDQAAKFVLALSFAHFLEDIADEMEAGSIVLVWDEERESRRLTRAGQDDVGFFHYCEDWALAKLPTQFREAECKLLPEYPGLVISGNAAQEPAAIVEGLIAEMHAYERKWLEALPLDRFDYCHVHESFTMADRRSPEKNKRFAARSISRVRKAQPSETPSSRDSARIASESRTDSSS
jgi:cell wall assembly regulator SMI1